MSHCAKVLVRPAPMHDRLANERRAAPRHAVALEALSRPVDGPGTTWWGATVRDLSSTGIGLTLCYPFRAGTFLAVDLQGPAGTRRTELVRVVHARDQADGTWHVGCEFVKRLTDSDIELMI
jgi:hypothetical protein